MFTFEIVGTLFAFVVLFAFMNVPPKNDGSEPTNSSFNPLLLISAIVPLLGIIFVIYPFMQQMHLVYIVEINRQANPTRAIEALEQSSRVYRIHDSILLATEFEKILHDAISARSLPNETIERLHTETDLVYAHAMEQHPLRTFLVSESVNVTYMYAALTNTPVSQDVIATAKRAHELAPGRIEPLLALANVLRLNHDLEAAKQYATQAVQMHSPQAMYLWKLAIFYALLEDWETASSLGIEALQTTHLTLQNANQLDWLIQYFDFKSKTDTKAKQTRIYLYEQAVLIEPNNFSLLSRLLNAYKQNNQQEKITETANRLKQQNPSSAASVDAFVQTLQ